MSVPRNPKIYHIVHVDKLPSIIAARGLLCDSEISKRTKANSAHGMGTTIGMSSIKERRLTELTLATHPGLFVGNCVPFYFCPRSIMLYLIHCANHPELTYRGGQRWIVHLEADLMATVAWANQNSHRWAFTLSNAGAYYFEDRADLAHLSEINWEAVKADRWADKKEGKQAEFLVERSFPWELVSRIGVISQEIYGQVSAAIRPATNIPHVEIVPQWYY